MKLPVGGGGPNLPFANRSSKCDAVGPAEGSGNVLNIEELEGIRSHPSWLPGLLTSGPVRVAFHCASSSARSVAFRPAWSNVFVELTRQEAPRST